MIDNRQIKDKVKSAIDNLLQKDLFLLQEKVHERSVSHKLAEYLQPLFQDVNVDCEYNRKGLASKKLDGIEECNERKKNKMVLPDIVIHERNSDNNILVIEIKTVLGDFACDFRKLELFTDQFGEYRYQLGIFIRFNKGNYPELKYFQNGREIKFKD